MDDRLRDQSIWTHFPLLDLADDGNKLIKTNVSTSIAIVLREKLTSHILGNFHSSKKQSVAKRRTVNLRTTITGVLQYLLSSGNMVKSRYWIHHSTGLRRNRGSEIYLASLYYKVITT